MLAASSPASKAFRRQKLAGSSSGRRPLPVERPGRQHADDLVRLAVEQQLTAEDAADRRRTGAATPRG